MHHRSLITLSLLAVAFTSSPVMASSLPTRPAVVMTTFRLQVQGSAQKGETYWVTYGPLAGRFGIVRLSQTGPGVFTASRQLPTAGRSRFTYIAGRGVVHTRAGLAPANPDGTLLTVSPVHVGPTGCAE